MTCTRCYVAENTAFGIDVHSGATVSITASEIVKNEQAPIRPLPHAPTPVLDAMIVTARHRLCLGRATSVAKLHPPPQPLQCARLLTDRCCAFHIVCPPELDSLPARRGPPR